MAKVIYICHRDRTDLNYSKDEIERVSQRMVPDHISASVYTKSDQDGIIFSIVPFNKSIYVQDNSIALGCLHTAENEWWKPGGPVPDGSFAIFRSDGTTVELVSDIVGSRTLWFIKTKTFFLASTSQRAIVACMGSYESNPKVFPWFLTNGYLGPDMSWDRRIQKVKADSKIVLNRNTWKIKELNGPIVFEEAKRSDQEHMDYIAEAIHGSFAKMDLEWERWVLALSGGYDSRGLLIMLKNRTSMRCVTWGDRKTINIDGTDTNIAPQLARKYGFVHEYCFTDRSMEAIERLMDRFLKASEGRVDHINASMDGFDRYRNMHDNGINGLIRGDIGFGWIPVILSTDVPLLHGFYDFRDYANVDGFNVEEFEPKVIPERFHKAKGETLSTWRDRLYHEYRIPTFLAGLSESRLSYIEQASPFLSRRIIEAVRTMPDRLRTDKAVFKRYIKILEPETPIASRAGIPGTSDLLIRKEIRNIIIDELSSANAKNLFPSKFTKRILHDLSLNRLGSLSNSKVSSSVFLKKLPRNVKILLGAAKRRIVKPKIKYSKILLRSFIISRMNKILKDDARMI